MTLFLPLNKRLYFRVLRFLNKLRRALLEQFSCSQEPHVMAHSFCLLEVMSDPDDGDVHFGLHVLNKPFDFPDEHVRSEERRVGKECRPRWSRHDEQTKSQSDKAAE